MQVTRYFFAKRARLRYVWLLAWQIFMSVCLSSVMFVHPTIRQLAHQKSRRLSKWITPNGGVKCKVVG